MKLLLSALLGTSMLAAPVSAQTPPAPTPPVAPTEGVKQADPLNPQKAEQEPRPVSQELQKQASQSRDAVPGQVAPEATPPVDAKSPKWDVNTPRGPGRDARIDTRSGTWMSLDVSPDGREVAFDLLGDLYVMPIGGGEARASCRLTSLRSGWRPVRNTRRNGRRSR